MKAQGRPCLNSGLQSFGRRRAWRRGVSSAKSRRGNLDVSTILFKAGEKWPERVSFSSVSWLAFDWASNSAAFSARRSAIGLKVRIFPPGSASAGSTNLSGRQQTSKCVPRPRNNLVDVRLVDCCHCAGHEENPILDRKRLVAARPSSARSP